jgi:predicted nucleotidyltransferase
MIDLSPDHLKIIKAILSKHIPHCEVRVFGSRATGRAWRYSDLDLLIVGPGLLDLSTLGRLMEDFEDSDLPMVVDIVDWHGISEEFRAAIEGDGVPIAAP